MAEVTCFRRIAQLIRDLRELNVIQEGEKVEYDYIDNGGIHKITIEHLEYGKSSIDRNRIMHRAFLKEFWQHTIEYDTDCLKVIFLVVDMSRS